ncbi:DUF305 domain-containing protein [Aeromicrobium sp.]|uniref:DUF305 domain-containing protein n=1 Tax=Aeromicrobium sp. TaxID=1871063 RepID=UPI00351800BA|nr:DUF305 domain-containing protein [Propionibacteriales bacterium]
MAFAIVAVVAVGAYLAINNTSGHDGHSASSNSSDSSSASNTSAKFNDTDVMFAQMMIPHHEQAVEMAQLAATRAGSSEVKALASKIEGAQGPEITTMKGWLKDWNAPSDGSSMGGMDHSAHDMEGMMSDSEMSDLESKSGDAFDQAFLSMMIEHHSGALGMAKSEIADGENPEAIALAKTIESTQQAEIKQMEALLK